MNNSGSDPPSLIAAMTFFAAILGFMGVTLAEVLDHGYALPAALLGTSVVGLVAAVIAVWFLHQISSSSAGSGSPPPPVTA